MRKKLLLLSFVLLNINLLISQSKTYKIRTIAFYNVENLFDTINDPNTLDNEFTPDGVYKYTSKEYWQKIDNVGKVISEIGFVKTGSCPVLVGLCEIENRSVLADLINSEHLLENQFKIIHFDSPDKRGIDVALLYREPYFKPIDQKAIEVKIWDEEGHRLYTRDQLLVTGLLENEIIHIIVNHWPSRRGGEQKSRSKRSKSAYITRQIISSIKEKDPLSKIIVMGDFNDDPTDKSVKKDLKSSGSMQKLTDSILYNPMYTLYKKGINTLGYRDGINLFDQILLSSSFIFNNGSNYTYKFYKAGVFNPKYLTNWSGRYSGYPLRSFENNVFIGGYSDHYPVYIYLIKEI